MFSQLIKLIGIIALLVASTIGYSMPPIYGTFEPNYPAGVNSPTVERLNRDNPDLEGEWNCLVILIDFPDYTWDNQNDTNFSNGDRAYSTNHFRDMLFSEGEYAHPGSTSEFTGSMRDYYKEISYDDFTVTGVATRWYRAPQNYSYYCNQDGEAGTGDDFGFGQSPNNAQGLVEAAIQLADRDVDFSDFDNDEDRAVDALFIIHAGPGAEEFGDAGASYIWSHKWQIEARQLDGVFITGYTMEPENGTVGVFCHEFGHALGLPDLYDTDGSSEGVGEWDLMGGGGWCFRPGDPLGTCPSHMSGWSKSQLGWVEVRNIEDDADGVVISPLESDRTVVRAWRNGEMGTEYFLLENRQRIGFDAGLTRRQREYDLPAPIGLLITHIDDEQGSNEDDSHRKVDIEEASPIRLEDGSWFQHLDGDRIRPTDKSLYNPNRGDDGDLWPGFTAISDDSAHWSGARSRTTFGINTTPSSSDYTGQPTLVSVSNVRFGGNNIICDIQISPPEAPLLVLGQLDISDGENGNGVLEPGDTLTIVPHLRNIGQQTATTVSLLLAYNGELDVTVEPQGAVGYPDIDGEQEAAPRVPFVVTIPDDAVDDATIILEGVANAAGNRHFDIEIVINLRSPGEWIKFPRNPVLVGTEEAWDAGGIASIDIIEYGDSLVAYYIGGTGVGSIGVGRAVSFDYGESWAKRPEPVIPNFEQGWAAGGAFGLAVIGVDDGFLMMIAASDGDVENEQISIGKATSDNGIDWEVSANPVIRAGGWCVGIFPLGQIDLLQFGNAYICSYGGTTQQGFVALGASRSLNLVNWIADDQPTILPTFDAGTFDAFVCFAPDVYLGINGDWLTYSGMGEDFVGRLGMITVIDPQNFERHIGTETGGSILEPSAEGWEAGGFMMGSRLFGTPYGQRMVYAVLGEGTGGIGLAIAAGNRSVPGEQDPIASALPRAVEIGVAYPNPFNGQTVIPFKLQQNSKAIISVYNIMGRTVFSEALGSLTAGEHLFTWSAGTGVGSGVYFVKIATEHGVANSRVLLLK